MSRIPPIAKNRAALAATADVDLNKVRHLIIRLIANCCTHIEIKAFSKELDEFRGPQMELGAITDEDWLINVAGDTHDKLVDRVVAKGGNLHDMYAVIKAIMDEVDEDAWENEDTVPVVEDASEPKQKFLC